MSIKDRIKFFQTLKANQEPKPLPKPLPSKTVTTKTEPPKPITDEAIKPTPPKTESKPIVSLTQDHLQQPSKNEPLQSPQVIGLKKSPMIFHQQPPRSAQIILQQKPPSIAPKELPKSQAPKSSEAIIQQKAPTMVQQQQKKQQSNLSKNPEKPPQKQGSQIMSVKQRLRLLEQSKFTIVQQPPAMKSCFVVSDKKPPVQEKSQTTNNNTRVQSNQIRVSAPQKTNTDEGEKRLTFQEKRLLAEGLLSKPRAPTKVYQTQQNQDNQSSQKPINSESTHEQNSHQIKVQLEPETQKIEEDAPEQNKKKEEKTDTDSEILFKEALKKESEPTLVTGQTTNLTLGVRKTMAKKRNNDDFDDL